MASWRTSFLILGLLSLGMSTFAHAQVQGTPALPAATISSFKDNPGQSLSNAPNGGDLLSGLVRDLVASDKSTLSSVAGLLSQANPAQQQSILTGLSDAAKLYVATDFRFANNIAEAVAQTDNQILIKAYAALAGDTGTSATAGGGGGGGGGGPSAGAVASGGPNNAAIPASRNFTRNSTPNLFNGSTFGTVSAASRSGT